MYKNILLTVCFATLGLLLSVSAEAGVILRVTAVNPSEYEEQKVVVKSYLPRGIKPEHIIDTGELAVAYDVRQGQYYVYKEVVLKPQAEIDYEIEIEDIWIIDEERLTAYGEHVSDLAEKLKKTEYAEVSGKLREEVTQNVDAIIKKQNETLVSRVSPIEHMSAYSLNKEVLKIVKEDIGTLENLVISMGGDPGQIMGESSIAVKRGGVAADILGGEGVASAGGRGGEEPETAIFGFGAAGFKTVSLKIEIKNPSQTESWTLPVKYYLPKEISASDVLDPGELELGFDFEQGLYYLFKEAVFLEPDETKIFDVLVRDKWTLNETNLLALKLHTENMVEGLKGIKEFDFARELGENILAEIDNLMGRQIEGVLDDEHIASFRQDSQSLENLRKNIERMEGILKQAGVIPEITMIDEQKLRESAEEMGISEMRLRQIKEMVEERQKSAKGGLSAMDAKGVKILAGTIFKGKAPTLASTWKIIFIVMGFLGVVSFVFFMVWAAQAQHQKGVKFDKIDTKEKK